MKRKLYALIVAASLLAPSLPAQEEGLSGLFPYDAPQYSQTVSYFLKAVKGSESFFIVLDDNDRLVLRPETDLPSSFTEIKNALWRISLSQSLTGEVAFSFNSLFRATILSLSRSELTAGMQNPGVNANLPGGDLYRWLPSVGSTPSAGANFFYVFAQVGGNEIIALAADEDLRVIPRVYGSFNEAGAAKDILRITPCVSRGFLPLTANDLNACLTANPFTAGQKQGLLARDEDRFSLSTNPAFPADFPFSSTFSFQAQGVHLEEDAQGFADVDTSKTYRTKDLYADTVNHWVALYAHFKTAEGLVDQGFVGVDTSYNLVNGTDPDKNSIRIAVLGDTWYHNEPLEKRKRLLDSYLFKFLYDPALNRLAVVSHGHITEAFEGSWSPAKADLIQANKYQRNSYLNYSSVGAGRNAPTLTDDPYKNGFYVESLKDDSHYSTIVEPGLYYLRVAGSKDRSRIGKYLRIGFKGELEFVNEADVLLYQPSYQWAIESNLYIAKIFNREVPLSPSFEENSPFISFDEYLGSDPRTFGVQGQNVFVMSGGYRDTLAYIPVANDIKASSSVGYYISDIKDPTYARLSFIYHTKSQSKYVSVANVNNKVLWVQPDLSKIAYFGLKEAYTEPYGYEPNIEGVAPLVRHYYRFTYPHDLLGTVQYLACSDETESHRYFISDSPDNSPLFVLREVDRSDSGDPAYMFCEVDPLHSTLSYFLAIDEDKNTLARTELPLSDVGVDAFLIKSSLANIYIGFKDNAGELKSMEENVQIFRTYAYDKEFLIGKPYLDSKSPAPASFNYLSLQAYGDEGFPQYFNLFHVRGSVMPQYLLISDYKTGTEDRFFSGNLLTVLTRSAENPAWIYTSFHEIPNDELTWRDVPRLGFIPAYVSRADSFLYIEGQPNKPILRAIFPPDERTLEGAHYYFLFTFRLINEEGQGFLIEGGYPEGSLAGNINNYIRVKLGVPGLVQSSYAIAAQDQESLFSLKLSDGTIKFPVIQEGLSNFPLPLAPPFGVVAHQGGLQVTGAQGKHIVLSDLLGKPLGKRFATADEEYFELPAGIVIVSVEGAGALKALVK
ncbi:MAG: DUF6383 domain-containing protein [Tannerellaceae bacterium]|nr:DUF6383 domain-containing protein [Tannerellaceae bacterium]